MNSGQLVRQAGVTIDTVRYYEPNGVPPPPARRALGYRDYPAGDIARRRFVRRAKELGFAPSAIHDPLALSDHREDDTADLKSAAAKKLAAVDRRMSALARIRTGIQVLVDAGKAPSCNARSSPHLARATPMRRRAHSRRRNSASTKMTTIHSQ